MANRNIKDAKDLSSGELIYFRGHAKATYMSNGATVEDAINSIGAGGGDMSNYYTKTQIDAKGYLTSVPSEYVTETELNDKGYLTSVPSEYVTETELNDKGYLTSVPSEYVTETELNDKGYLTEHQSIKTVNGTSLIGSGNVVVGHKTLQTSTSSSMTLTPNVYHRNTNTSLTTLTITLGSITNDTILNEYLVEFTTRSAGTTVNLPSNIKWINGETPTFEPNATYQISIVNNLGVVAKFK